MPEKCPVCRKDIKANDKACSVCGFADLHREFITIEDAELWTKSVVEPYRKKYEESKKPVLDDGFDADGYNQEGFDRMGYNRAGFDKEGYDRSGYNKEGFYKLTGLNREGYDRDGYDKNGYNKLGYDRKGFDKSGYNKDGYDRLGFNKDGIDKEGYNREGFNAEGYTRKGFDRIGYDKDGYNQYGYDKSGFNRNGLNSKGFDKDGYDKNGYDAEGYNRNGYNQKGYSRAGYDAKGFNVDGFDRNGFNADGYDCNGFNKKGVSRLGARKSEFDEQGYHKLTGYDVWGYDRDGFDVNGYDRNGFNKFGYNRNGFDKLGYDHKGYNKKGYNRYGYNKEGYDKNGYNKSGYDADGYDARGFDSNGFNRKGFDFAGYDKEGFDENGKDHREKTKKYNVCKSTINGIIILLLGLIECLGCSRILLGTNEKIGDFLLFELVLGEGVYQWMEQIGWIRNVLNSNILFLIGAIVLIVSIIQLIVSINSRIKVMSKKGIIKTLVITYAICNILIYVFEIINCWGYYSWSQFIYAFIANLVVLGITVLSLWLLWKQYVGGYKRQGEEEKNKAGQLLGPYGYYKADDSTKSNIPITKKPTNTSSKEPSFLERNSNNLEWAILGIFLFIFGGALLAADGAGFGGFLGFVAMLGGIFFTVGSLSSFK